jgi:hypothetical protein
MKLHFLGEEEKQPGELPSLSEGPIDFVLRSAEATLALPYEEQPDMSELIVDRDSIRQEQLKP